MDLSRGLVAVDWGTSNRRVFVLDAAGNIIRSSEDDHGILNCSDFPAEVAGIRADSGGLPILMAGMVGSNRGWVEVPYVHAPATLATLAAGVKWVEPGVGIVPGVSYLEGTAADVMRGEEVQLVGALALGAIGDGLVAHPGTHGKWVEIADSSILRFRTVMTGDVFAALKAKSILSDLLAHPAGTGEAFVAGVDHALENSDLTAELFSTRARVLLGAALAEDASSYISGLLIGSEVRTGLGRVRADNVPLIGEAVLTERFAIALARAGRTTTIVDGDAAFIAGIRAIAGAAA